MNDFLHLLGNSDAESLFHPLDILIVMSISVLCLFIVTRCYQATHRGTSYAQSYIHSLFLMGLCTAIVMMIIGSNIARAFSLVGALSIIRFRTAVKDVRDTAFLFFAIVVGMGCGTGFYLHTVTFTIVCALFMWVLFKLEYAQNARREDVLKVTFDRSSGAGKAVAAFLEETLDDSRLINSIRNYDGDDDTHVYVVASGEPATVQSALDDLQLIDGVSAAALYRNDQQVTL